MPIYIEKDAKDYPQTKKIQAFYKAKTPLYINNYKNIFDQNEDGFSVEKSLIVAKLRSNAITKAPPGYGHTMRAYFFKTGLNCVFDCSYCYLKGLFKNSHMVVFVNYDDIKNQITTFVEEQRKEQKTQDIWFYSGDYSDILGMDSMTNFCQEFISFFEGLNNNHKTPSVMMEIRTKSAQIRPLLQLDFVPKYTEISFSLNPQELISLYEKGTSSLKKRVESINILLEKGYKVGLRFLPILPVKNYKDLYTEFTEYIKKNIDMSKIYSSFAAGLLYTKKDYNRMLKKYPDLDILYMLELENDDFYRESKRFRDEIYNLFKELDKGCIFCLEN